MNVTAKHKKARIFRDFLIETNGINMFKEEEKENAKDKKIPVYKMEMSQRRYELNPRRVC